MTTGPAGARRPWRLAFSSTEIIVGAAIFAIALVPIIQMITSGTKPTAFNEYHLVAQSASTHLVDRVTELILSKGFAELESMAAGQKTNILETRSYNRPTELGLDKATEGTFFQQPEVFLTNLSDSGASLVQVTVVLSWTLPGDPTNKKWSFTMERLVSRPDTALMADYAPRQEKGGANP